MQPPPATPQKNPRDALSPLDFSPPECRYESSALFKNDMGQTLSVQVWGLDKAAVEQYTRELRASFEVAPVTPDQPPKEPPSKYAPKTEPQPEISDQPSPQDLDIELEVVETNGIEPPLVLRATLHPTIGLATHRYQTMGDTDEIDVTVTVSGGSIRATLREGRCSQFGSLEDSGKGDVFIETPEDNLIPLHGETSSAKRFCLRVKGENANNKYSYTSSVTLSRL